METKANGNTVDSDYYLDGLVPSQVEKKSNGTLVSQHAMEYSANGDRVKDTAKVQNADNHAAYLENVFAYTFDPLDRIAKVEKKDATGATVQSTESYTHDPAGNVVAQTVKDVSTSYSYDRNRLLTATTGGSTAPYTYDPFGRLSQVSAGGKVIERNTYDGCDRVIKNRPAQHRQPTRNHRPCSLGRPRLAVPRLRLEELAGAPDRTTRRSGQVRCLDGRWSDPRRGSRRWRSTPGRTPS